MTHTSRSARFRRSTVSDASVITAENYLDAGDILMSIQDFELAKRFFQRAQTAGADELTVAIGMANAHLAFGETSSAETLLANAGDPEEELRITITLFLAPMFTASARILCMPCPTSPALILCAPDNLSSQQAEYDLAGEQGRQLTEGLSVGSWCRPAPIFEDENIYQLDARLRGVQNIPGLLPPPRRSIETFADARFRVKTGDIPVLPVSSVSGTLAAPSRSQLGPDSAAQYLRHDIQWGHQSGRSRRECGPHYHARLAVHTPARYGISARLESESLPAVRLRFKQPNRQLALVQCKCYPRNRTVHQSGSAFPRSLCQSKFHSRTPLGQDRIHYRLWRTRRPVSPHDPGVLSDQHLYWRQRKFGSKIRATALAEYLRAWRVQDSSFAIAQSIRPAFYWRLSPLRGGRLKRMATGRKAKASAHMTA